TVDVEGRGMPASAGRGLAADRNLRQTFQNPQTFDVQQIVLSQRVEAGGVNAGYEMRIYEVDDVNADTWTPGALVAEILFPTGSVLPVTSLSRLGFALSDADVFTLPQRNDGVMGYGIEISNGDDATTIGTIRHTNFTDVDGNLVDYYATGKFYTESGGQSGSGHRDIGLALSPSVLDVPIPEPTAAALAAVGLVAGLRRRRRS
ncbi:MAG: hypothetical protein KDA61_12535, partial [Planctomycetales bacterium]|nr:hypothetical protein [Planctomycetales bacterium]